MPEEYGKSGTEDLEHFDVVQETSAFSRPCPFAILEVRPTVCRVSNNTVALW